LLTPKPGPEPRINGPKVYGCRPGRPLLYRIPATGQRPITFSADNLPSGLVLDPASGIITGNAPAEAGRYEVTLKAASRAGSAERPLAIVVGDTLALTPPMGWNSWYIHYYRVTAADMRAAADAMIDSGMADFGYQYVNIDDCWMEKPGSDDPMLGGLAREAIDDAGGLERVERIGVTVGPGSFTGLRVGVTVANGFSYGLKLPVAVVRKRFLAPDLVFILGMARFLVLVRKAVEGEALSRSGR